MASGGAYRRPALAWAFVPAYAAHILEEWYGGFPEWFAVVAGGPMDRGSFLALNLIGLAAMAAGVAAGVRYVSLGWMIVAVATAALLNSFAHIAASVVTASYSPGLVTGAALWLPLAHLVLVRAYAQTRTSYFAGGVLAGLGAHAVVTLAAVAAGR